MQDLDLINIKNYACTKSCPRLALEQGVHRIGRVATTSYLRKTSTAESSSCKQTEFMFSSMDIDRSRSTSATARYLMDKMLRLCLLCPHRQE